MNDAQFHSYQPSDGHGLPHDPFKAIVAPRPIGWISTTDLDGRVNLAPYSFFNAIADQPPLLMFASAGWKDSVANIEQTREFVWNFVSLPMAQAMNATSASLPPGTSEFEAAGIGMLPSRVVAAPRVAGSPAQMEAKVVDIIRLRDLDGKQLDRWMVIGQVVAVHVDRQYLGEDGLFDTGAAQPVQRAGYLGAYFSAHPAAQFEMLRPA